MSMTENQDGLLNTQEQAALDALEDKLGRGVSVKWDEPKTIRGIHARPTETVMVRDYSDPDKQVEKMVCTLRTAEGLRTIWSGPSGLEDLFAITGAGQPVIVTFKGERVGESGRTYKAFDVVIGDAPVSAADDDLPF